MSVGANEVTPTNMVNLRRMSKLEYDDYYKESLQSLVDELARAYDLSQSEALKIAKKSFDTLLPDGHPAAPDQFLYVIEESRQIIGVLWFGIKRDRQIPEAYVWDIVIKPIFRGKGFGKQAILALEEEVKSMGLSRISLNVFGHNDVAQRMYKRLAYRTVSSVMAKNL